MTFEELQKANETLSTMDIKGKDYVLVNERVKAFRMLFPNGSIVTDIIDMHDGVVVMKATIRDDGGEILASGLAYEKESSSYINKTSYIENCETSAVGRALGFIGIGIDTAIASYEEVQNAVNNQGEKPKKAAEKPAAEEPEPEEPTTRMKAVREWTKEGIHTDFVLRLYKCNSLAEMKPEMINHALSHLKELKKKQDEETENKV